MSLWALLLACRSGDDVGGGFSNDAAWAPPQPPVIVTDYGDGGLGGDGQVQGGMSVSPVVRDKDASAAGRSDVNVRDSLPAIDRAGPRPEPMPTCSVLAQDCGAARGCYFLETGTTTACLPAGDLEQSTACGEHRDCAPGLLCIEAFGNGAGSTCQPVCDLARSESCAGGSGCRKLTGVTLGYCEP